MGFHVKHGMILGTDKNWPNWPECPLSFRQSEVRATRNLMIERFLTISSFRSGLGSEWRLRIGHCHSRIMGFHVRHGMTLGTDTNSPNWHECPCHFDRVRHERREIYGWVRFLNRHCIPHIEMTIADFPMWVFAAGYNFVRAGLRSLRRSFLKIKTHTILSLWKVQKFVSFQKNFQVQAQLSLPRNPSSCPILGISQYFWWFYMMMKEWSQVKNHHPWIFWILFYAYSWHTLYPALFQKICDWHPYLWTNTRLWHGDV